MAAPELSHYYRTVLNAIPMPVFVMEEDMVVRDFNLTAGNLLSGEADLQLKRRGGDIMRCVHSREHPGGCGRAKACRDCVLRNAVNQALAGYSLVRQGSRMEFLQNGQTKEVHLLVTSAPFDVLGERVALLLLEDVSEVVRLRSLIPICGNCKRVRDDRNYWQQVETYFHQHEGVDFSQSLCPECRRELMTSCEDPGGLGCDGN